MASQLFGDGSRTGVALTGFMGLIYQGSVPECLTAFLVKDGAHVDAAGSGDHPDNSNFSWFSMEATAFTAGTVGQTLPNDNSLLSGLVGEEGWDVRDAELVVLFGLSLEQQEIVAAHGEGKQLLGVARIEGDNVVVIETYSPPKKQSVTA